MKSHANMQGYIESEQAKQQQVAVCVPERLAMKNKQLSPRLAGEWFRHLHTTIYWHVSSVH